MRRSCLPVAVTVAMAAGVLMAGPASAGGPDDGSERGGGHGHHHDVEVQLLAMNDFHGRISLTEGGDSELVVGPGPDGLYGDQTPDDPDDPVDDETVVVGGAAHVAATVDAARQAFVDDGGRERASFFVGAGDLVSASPYNSSAFKDEPTIEVFNAMGLDVSSVGNHEFDRGTQELRRISGATDGTYTDDVTACEGITPGVDGCFGEEGHEFTGADFPYLAANVISKKTGEPMLPPYQVFTTGHGKKAQKLALIGVVTDTTPTIVSPAGVEDVEFVDEATAVNEWVPVLQDMGIEAIGVLIHEGGQNTGEDAAQRNGCDQLSGPIVDINNEVDAAVDLIISAHTHQAYDCLLTDPAGQPRLVTQAGYYGRLVTDIRLTIDARTGDVDRLCENYTATNLPVTRDVADPEVQGIVDYWEARGVEAGSAVVGSTTAAITRAQNAAGEPVRDAESGLGNLIAQEQLESVQEEQFGLPVLAFMNPGGLRSDLPAGELTFGDLFSVQPFGNTVNTVTLTGADIRAVLEQQFQLDQPRGSTLVLGTSEGFSYRYDPARPYGDRVDAASIMLDGTAIDPAAEYRVAANSFLVAGGDSFTAFTNGTAPTSGPVDVDTAVAYFAAHGPVAPPAADHSTAVPGGNWPANPATGLGGDPTEPVPPTTVDGRSGVDGPVEPCPCEHEDDDEDQGGEGSTEA